MKAVKQMELWPGISVKQLVLQMEECGVLGAGRLGKAAKIVKEMFNDKNYTVFLTLAGALVPGGLRKIISKLIAEKHVHVLVSTGANMVHDMVEALNFKHFIGSAKIEDAKLKEAELGRIADIYVEMEAFRKLEKWLNNMLMEIPEEKRRRIAPHELLYEIGKRLNDPDSILATAAKNDVSVFCPGLPDSIAGFQLWMFSQDKTLTLDPLLDIKKIVDIVYEAKKVGMIILGGGWPKHFALFANTFKEGVDCAVQITMDRPEPGGLSGAPLEEAISWGKVKPGGKMVTVISDVTIAFPLIVAAALS